MSEWTADVRLRFSNEIFTSRFEESMIAQCTETVPEESEVERKILVRKKVEETPKKESKQSVVLSKPNLHTLFTINGNPHAFPIFDDAEVGLDELLIVDNTLEQ